MSATPNEFFMASSTEQVTAAQQPALVSLFRAAWDSGNRLDAFPSGHAVHVGALASAASRLPERQRNLVWAVGAGLVLTRVVLLAHWVSDVAAGLAVGALTERLLRLVTGYGRGDAGDNKDGCDRVVRKP